jgi:hypothetical protein
MKTKKIYLASIIICLLASCKSNTIEEKNLNTDTTAVTADTSIDIIDDKTISMLEEVKKIQALFTGDFNVYNASSKKLKQTSIDSNGAITNSSLYKQLRFTKVNEKGYILLMKNTDENNPIQDTFEYVKTRFIELYKAQTNSQGIIERKELVYRFERIN